MRSKDPYRLPSLRIWVFILCPPLAANPHPGTFGLASPQRKRSVKTNPLLSSRNSGSMPGFQDDEVAPEASMGRGRRGRGSVLVQEVYQNILYPCQIAQFHEELNVHPLKFNTETSAACTLNPSSQPRLPEIASACYLLQSTITKTLFTLKSIHKGFS